MEDQQPQLWVEDQGQRLSESPTCAAAFHGEQRRGLEERRGFQAVTEQQVLEGGGGAVEPDVFKPACPGNGPRPLLGFDGACSGEWPLFPGSRSNCRASAPSHAVSNLDPGKCWLGKRLSFPLGEEFQGRSGHGLNFAHQRNHGSLPVTKPLASPSFRLYSKCHRLTWTLLPADLEP